MRNFRIFTLVLVLLTVFSACNVKVDTYLPPETVNSDTQPTASSTEPSTSKPGKTLLDTISVHFIDVGQGDSILIQSNKGNMLIDAGENNQGTTVVDYIRAKESLL